jgi:8-oxo-dGTP pyrophosphatase MutT (NUDIX family)
MKDVVAVILINEEKKLLMQLRDDKPTIVSPNCWGLLGGSVEKGESFEQALRREIKEEINYSLVDFTYVGDLDDLMGSLVHIYKSKINKRLGELVLTEGQRLGYFSFDEIFKLKTPEIMKYFLIKNKSKII